MMLNAASGLLISRASSSLDFGDSTTSEAGVDSVEISSEFVTTAPFVHGEKKMKINPIDMKVR